MSRATIALGAALDRSGLLKLALAARRRGLWPYGGLTVLTYHRVVAPSAIGELDADMIDATPEAFDEQMSYLRRTFHPVAVEEVLEASGGGRPLPPDSVLVTFDDGYRDNFENALPVLRRHGIKALFFVATGYLTDRALFWWEAVSLLVRRSAAPALRIDYPAPEALDLSTPAAKIKAANRLNQIIKDHHGLDLDRFLAGIAAGCGVSWTEADGKALGDATLMTWSQVKGLREAGMGVGSHTHKHRVLQTLPAAELAADLAASRAALEEALGEAPRTIAYPVGKSVAGAPQVREAVARAGYELGFTTAAGINRLGPGQDLLDLRRLTVDRGLPTGLARTWMTFPFLAARATTGWSLG